MRSLRFGDAFSKVSIILLCVMAIGAAASALWAAEWHHYSDGKYEYWDLDGHSKFCKALAGQPMAGQWWHYSTYGSWQRLSIPGLTYEFIGDGSWYDMGYGLKYRYDINSDNGFFGRGSSYRFYYGYGPGQWHTSGCAGGWYNIGAAGLSAGVVGNGGVYDLGNGLKFRYDAGQDYGFYYNATHYRFYYRYTPGQWYTSGYGGGWYTLGASGICAGVVGNGGVYDLGNGLKFRYDAGQDYGFYYHGFLYRFYYRYTPGQWYQTGYGGGWRTTGTSGTCAWVLADGNLHDLGNGLKFRYVAENDYGYYFLGADALHRFSYHYTLGQWYTSGYGGGWYELGNAGLPAWGFFDGPARDLGNGFEFRYDQALDCGYFTRDEADRFYYAYIPGQWSHRGNSSQWTALTDGGYSAAFIGNGAGHDLGNGFSYYYANDSGVFRHGNNNRFSYRYGPSQWYHAGNATDMAALTAGGYSAAFIGDGGEYNLGNGFTYSYASNQYGYFKVGDTERFYYNYAPGQWFHRGNTTDWAELTPLALISGYSAAFIGDGHAHYLVNGVSYYHSGGNGWFKIGGHERFWYEYGQSQWSHCRAGGSWVVLSASDVSAQYVGDGTWHDLGNGWDYLYAHTSDYGYFKTGDAERFSYRYGPGQWYHKGDTTAWEALTSSNYSLAFIADGSGHDLGNGFSYSYLSANNEGLFKSGTTERFFYAYGPSQWSHKGDSTAWGTLSAEVVSAGFVGDGTWHDIGYGLTYQYSAGDGKGYFKVGTAQRFSYDYGPSQWSHKGNATGWVALTADSYAADFIGDGNWHVLDSGWGYTYSSTGDAGYFKTGDKERFAYSYGPSQWLHKGDTTDWGTLSGTGAFLEFVGDGNWHDLGNGFTYQYVTADEEGHFKVGASERFYFSYGPSQWFHRGGTTDWAALTGQNYGPQFVGDGAQYDLGGGITYYYTTGSDNGWFKVGGHERFWYMYAPGLWFHSRADSGSWQVLSAADISALYVGDGDWHDLGTGWDYQYVSANGAGYFKADDKGRFAYAYATGQWSHKGDTGGWAVLSSGNRSAQFIGDGAWYDLGNGFSYSYTATGEGTGSFWLGTAQRFSYAYGPGQWSHRGNQDTGWIALTGTGYAADFAGNGAQYDLGNGITYYYTISGDNGWFRVGGHERFWYKYAPGQWSHSRADSGSWQALSATGISALYVGDGDWHDLGNGWAYQYQSVNSAGYFKAGDTERFSYAYATGQWSHKGDSTDWATLSAEWISAAFVGDGSWHDVGAGWAYQYVTADGNGYFKVGSSERFAYAYGPSQWSHRGDHTDWAALTDTGYSAAFIGDGAEHVLEDGFSYSYASASDYGCFNEGVANFAYSYAPGQWLHRGYDTDWAALTVDNYSITYIGDGDWHDVGNGWSYAYSWWDIGYGYFKVGDTGDTERFRYGYALSQWYHGPTAWEWAALTAGGVSAEFVGDGEWHDLGNGFTYRYLIAEDQGYFRLGADERFYYAYGPWQWSHRGNGTDWAALTDTNFSAQFLGDGGWHDLGNGFSYQHVGGDSGYFKEGDTLRFSYWYVNAQWLHRSDNSDLVVLSDEGVSAEFIGVGDWHYMSSGWWYHYDLAGHTAYWGHSSDGNYDYQRFYYTYTIGLWQHKGGPGCGDFHHLGSEGWWSPSFLGDGEWHQVNDGGSHHKYQYSFGGDNLGVGTWKSTSTGHLDWQYIYYSGGWFVREPIHNSWVLDPPHWGVSTGEHNPE